MCYVYMKVNKNNNGENIPVIKVSGANARRKGSFRGWLELKRGRLVFWFPYVASNKKENIK